MIWRRSFVCKHSAGHDAGVSHCFLSILAFQQFARMSRPSLPAWPIMVLLLGLLSCVAPATIDAYLPAFGALERDFGVMAHDVQRTLGVYTGCYACMLLLHGTLSDALGRRPVIMASLVVYIGASLLAAVAPSFGLLMVARALQGLSAGAGVVVGHAIIRDCYDGIVAQRSMAWLVIIYNLSPALAPVVGGHLAVQYGWRSIFVLLTILALAALVLSAKALPETLPQTQRQHLSWRTLLKNWCRTVGQVGFIAPACAFSLVFGAQAFLIGGAPNFLRHALTLPETRLAALFIPMVIGAMGGAFFAARVASRWPQQWISRLAYLLMTGSCAIHAAYLYTHTSPSFIWVVLPPACFTAGLAMSVPAMTLRILSSVPTLSGTAASILGFLQMLVFSVVSGWFVPLTYGHPDRLAFAMLACVLTSALALFVVDRTVVRWQA